MPTLLHGDLSSRHLERDVHRLGRQRIRRLRPHSSEDPLTVAVAHRSTSTPALEH